MKKIVTLIIIAALCLQMVVIPILAEDEDNVITETYSAEILPVKGGASAIATMTFDDGVHNTSLALYELLKEYGLKASLMVVPQRVERTTGSYSSLAQLREFSKDGYVDILSHSYTHLYMHDEGENAKNNTEENIQKEIVESYKYLASKFPNQYPISMAVPGGNYSVEAEAAMMKTYYAARYQNSKATATNIQSLTPAESIEPGGWYNLTNMWLKDADIANGKLIEYLDACVQNGGWFFTGCHNFDPAGGNYDISVENLKILMSAMKAYQDSGELWVATFSEATRYLREYESSIVKQYKTKDVMFVEVVMEDTTPGGLPLTSDIFNMPLTVKVVIPEGWTNIRFRQNGNESYVNSFKENGKTYAYLEVVPNSGAVSITNADEAIPTTPVNASFTNAPGGATAIATLTFDDGLVGTANALNDLCAQYDCKASLMLISDRINETNVGMWNDIFSKGYLHPESHSSNHEYLDSSHQENHTPENIEDEITGSLIDLNKWFPDYDTLGFGIPYSTYISAAYEELYKSFYSARGGSCVLSYSSFLGKMQTINPKHGSENGDWYQLFGVRLMGEKGKEYPQYAVLTVDNILGYLDKCVKDGGWFIGTAHGIVPGENLDITVEDLGQIMSVMQRYQNDNKLWVATMTDATKYIRERQNSKVSAYTTFDGLYVDVTMAEATKEGLPLPADVFDLPLTVKVQLPDKWGRVVYSQAGGEEKTSYAFTEDGVKYAYIDLVPNGGTAYVTNIGDPTNYVESLGIKQSASADDSLTYNIYIPTDSHVSGVYSGIKQLPATVLDNGYTMYSVGDIDITSCTNKFTFTIKFTLASGYVDYVFEKSVTSYMIDILVSDDTTEKEKQLAYDFLVYSKYMIEKFSEDDMAKLVANEAVDNATSFGFESTPPVGTPADLGNATSVLTGAAFAINEKPYYVFYLNEDFTGTLTFAYGEGSNRVTTEYQIINGYYHCEHYVIYEVESVFYLADEITITAEGKVGGENVTASGEYSLANFVDGLGGESAPEYAKALYSYAISAKNYNS